MSIKHTDAYDDMFLPKKPDPKPNIWCYKCKSDSGWTNAEIARIRGNYTLKCQNCKQPTIKLMSNVPTIEK